MKVAIVGAEEAKFDKTRADSVFQLLPSLLRTATCLVSGGCHLGGVDIWAEDYAYHAGIERQIFYPEVKSWQNGYRLRNIRIATACDIPHNIVVQTYPAHYAGMRFGHCYHCGTNDHIKSGGCWTAKYAKRLGKPAYLHILKADGSRIFRAY